MVLGSGINYTGGLRVSVMSKYFCVHFNNIFISVVTMLPVGIIDGCKKVILILCRYVALRNKEFASMV